MVKKEHTFAFDVRLEKLNRLAEEQRNSNRRILFLVEIENLNQCVRILANYQNSFSFQHIGLA
jgi:hypothetical protein